VPLQIFDQTSEFVFVEHDLSLINTQTLIKFISQVGNSLGVIFLTGFALVEKFDPIDNASQQIVNVFVSVE